MKNNREINCTYQNCCGSCSHSLRACVIPNNVKILHGKNSRTKKDKKRGKTEHLYGITLEYTRSFASRHQHKAALNNNSREKKWQKNSTMKFVSVAFVRWAECVSHSMTLTPIFWLCVLMLVFDVHFLDLVCRLSAHANTQSLQWNTRKNQTKEILFGCFFVSLQFLLSHLLYFVSSDDALF